MENRCGWKPIRNEDFQESDMWEIMERTGAINIPEFAKPSEPEQSPIGPLSRQLPSAAKLIPRTKNPTPEPKLIQHSAPVNIPKWSKSPMARSSVFTDQDCYDDDDDYDSDDFDGKRFLHYGERHEYDDDDDDDHEEGKLPPHEWLARKQRRKQISSFSVCEGAGRTLKGRDLRMVRHAVLTKTGFI